MTIKKFSPEGFELDIYAEEANINYFLNTALVPVSAAGVVNKSTTVKSHTRRRYVGDTTPSNVSGGDRVFMYDPGRINLQTLPGEPFILDDGTEKRQFTFNGNVVDLHAFLVSDVKAETKLYTSGAPYVIEAASNAI
jgi:hypothetical protein